VFAVSKVLDAERRLKVRKPKNSISSMINYTAQEGSATIDRGHQLRRPYYNVYRSVVVSGQTLSFGQRLALSVALMELRFTDPNIVPDFTHTAPIHNPFAPGAIESIRSTRATQVTLQRSASPIRLEAGFVGQAIVDDSGAIVNVLIKYGGSGLHPILLRSLSAVGRVQLRCNCSSANWNLSCAFDRVPAASNLRCERERSDHDLGLAD
jgi:hypothetical protein